MKKKLLLVIILFLSFSLESSNASFFDTSKQFDDTNTKTSKNTKSTNTITVSED